MKMLGIILCVLFVSPSTVVALSMSFSGPSTTTLHEDATDEVQLTLITVTGVTTGQTLRCYLNPSMTQFWVKLDPSSQQYGIYQVAMPYFSFKTTPSYTIVAECTDDVSTASLTYIVNLDKNDSPTLTNLNNYTSLSAVSTPTGTLVFTVTATDPDNDTLSYSMDCYVLGALSTSCPFTIFDSGDIITTSDLGSTTTTSFDLRVTVTDYPRGNQNGPQSLIVSITDINTAPVINSNSLPYTTVVTENTGLGVSVYQVDITDPDAGDVHTYTATFNPTTASNYFTVDSSSGLVKTSTVTKIDYDTLSATFTSCTVDITVSDTYGSDTNTLTINIANVNEAPTFAKSLYTLSGTESAAGTSFGTPNYGVTDPEGDATTYGIDCATFNIDSSTGEITLSIDYDRDDASVASSVTCGITVSDGVLSSTASLEVFIGSTNDNSPHFVQNSYSFHVSPYARVGDIIDAVSATDGDLGPDGVVSYQVQSGAYSDVFGVDTSGNMYVRQALNDTMSGLTATVRVRACDKGNNKDTVTVSFVVQATTTLTTTTTTDRQMTFFESVENVSWISALMIVLLGLAVFISYQAYQSQVFFKICSSCSECECKLPKRKKKFDFHHSFEDEFDLDTPSPTPPLSTSIPPPASPVGWSFWNSSDKKDQGIF